MPSFKAKYNNNKMSIPLWIRVTILLRLHDFKWIAKINKLRIYIVRCINEE